MYIMKHVAMKQVTSNNYNRIMLLTTQHQFLRKINSTNHIIKYREINYK